MALLYLLIAVAAGSMLPIQAGMNARLAKSVGSSFWAAAISGIVLTVSLVLMAWALARGGPRMDSLKSLPWWAWCGGFAGAALLAATASLVPRLGAAKLISLVIAGQIICSLAIDNFGLLGVEPHPIDLRRVSAAALLLAGAALLR